MHENVVIKSSTWTPRDIEILFGDEEVYFADSTEYSQLMKELQVYESTTRAKKDGRFGQIPTGFTFEYKANKKTRLWIWNPN